MGVNLRTETKPGELYIDKNGSLWEIESFFKKPSVVLSKITDCKQTVGGAFGCLGLQKYRKLTEVSRGELREVIAKTVDEIQK